MKYGISKCGFCNDGTAKCNLCYGYGHIQNQAFRTTATCKNCHGSGKKHALFARELGNEMSC